jgi:carbon-monoxide dehydrogenase large subunit
MSTVAAGMRQFGAAVKRLEDPRLLLGRARYAADVVLPGMVEVAFLRSPHAHARILRIDASAARAHPGVIAVFTAADLPSDLGPMRVEHDPQGGGAPFRTSERPLLAGEAVRFVGEAVAAVIACDRATAEDALALVEVAYAPLPAVVDAEAALAPGAPRLHPAWRGNLFQETGAVIGEVDAAFGSAHLVVSATFRTGRHMALPLEARACVAAPDEGGDGLVIWSSTQMPHVVRGEIARALRVAEARVRVVATDVGGGFGLKAHIFPEDVLVPFWARRLGCPVRWIEDRLEHMSAAMHAKQQVIAARLALDTDGTIIALSADVVCDMGAYAEHPWPNFEATVTTMTMPLAYRIPAYAFTTRTVATNKTPSGAYRGIGQPLAVFALERLMDRAARRLGLALDEIRRRNMVADDAYPHPTIIGSAIESGSHRQALDRALEAVGGLEAFRREQAEALASGRRIGLGLGCYVEVSAPPSAMWQMMGPRIGGFEPASVRMEADGSVTVSVGISSQGQSHATTFAQLAADTLGVPLDRVRVVQGDTASSPRGTVAGGSKGAVVVGGAVLKASGVLADRLLAAAARRAQTSPDRLRLAGGAVRHVEDDREIMTVEMLADAIWLGRVPLDGGIGLEAIAQYEPAGISHSNATHLAIVEVDDETGQVRILRYVVVEDCGKLINPTVVAGQIQGGVAQGIGTALYEEVAYDADGQILTGTLADYLVPGAGDVPRAEIHHIETPSPFTEGGIKGTGEGGAIGPPAAIANAIADAFGPADLDIAELPITPERLLRLAGRLAGD